MRRLSFLLLATLLAACATAAPTDAPRAARAPASAPAAVPTDFLLDSAAGDFRAHPPTPAGFRNVHYGQLAAPDGTVSHRLCGEFQVTRSDGEPEWVAFTTLKTSGYEQWLGGNGAAYCTNEVRWSPGDLSAELQRRFDALR